MIIFNISEFDMIIRINLIITYD